MARKRGDKIVSATTIRRYRRVFRGLSDWIVEYFEDEKGTSGQCTCYHEEKRAVIFPCPRKVGINRYVFHEMLHIALFAAGRGKKKQEVFVRDLCRYVRTISTGR